MENFFQKITGASIAEYQAWLVQLELSPTTIKRRLSALRKFCAWAEKEGYLEKNPFVQPLKTTRLVKAVKKLPFALDSIPYLSKAYKTYHSLSITPYLHYGILIIFCAAIGFGVYQQFFARAPEPLAYPTGLTRPKRYLSFQGRLTDSSNNPITDPTNFVFKLYDEEGTGCPPTGGIQLWTSSNCSVDPDQDGIFSAILGSDCGSEIDPSVFAENDQVWLEITVGTPPDDDEILCDRIQIATVAYALNAETLQGYPPAAIAIANTIPVVNNAGNIVIGSTAPTFQGTVGTLAIEGQTGVTIRAAAGQNGNINLAPKGTGRVIGTFEASTGNLLDIQGGANIGGVGGKEANAVIYGYAGTNSTNLNLLKLEAGASAVPKFTVNAAGDASAAGILRAMGAGNSYFAGNVGIGTTEPGYKLDVQGGDFNVSGNLYTGGTQRLSSAGALSNITGYTQASGAFSFSGGGNFSVDSAGFDVTTGGAVSGVTTLSMNNQLTNSYANTAAINLTGAGAGITFGSSGPYQIITGGSADLALMPGGNLGIGTTGPSQKLHIDGNMRLTGALYDLNNQAGNSGQILSTTGSGVDWVDISSVGVGGTGTTNYLPKWVSSSTLGNSLLYEDGTNVGIGTTGPGAKLDILGDGSSAALKVSSGYIDLPVGTQLRNDLVANDLIMQLPFNVSPDTSRGISGVYTRTDSASGSTATYTDENNLITSSAGNSLTRTEKSYISRGEWIEDPRRNMILYSSNESAGTPPTGWTNSGLSTADSSTTYRKHLSYSMRLIAGASAGQLYRATTAVLTAANNYPVTAYVYNGTAGAIGGTVDVTVAKLYSSLTISSTIYTNMGGGWWLLRANLTGTGASPNVGLQVEAGKTVYLDAIQIDGTTANAGVNYPSTYIYNTSAVYDRGTETLYYPAYYNYGKQHLTQDQGTYSFWFKPNFATSELASGNKPYLMETGTTACQDSAASNCLIKIYMDGADDKIYAAIYITGVISDYTTVAVSSAAQSFSAYTDHFVSVRWNSSTGALTLNVDGVETTDSNAAWTPPAFNTGHNIYIGSPALTATTGNRANSLISDVASFDRALTAAEVAQIYNSKAPIQDFERKDQVMLSQTTSGYQIGNLRISGTMYSGGVSTGAVAGSDISGTYFRGTYTGFMPGRGLISDLAALYPFNFTLTNSKGDGGTFSRADAANGSASYQREPDMEIATVNANIPRFDRGPLPAVYTSKGPGNPGLWMEASCKNVALYSSFEPDTGWTAEAGITKTTDTTFQIHGTSSSKLVNGASAQRYYRTIDFSGGPLVQHQISGYAYLGNASAVGNAVAAANVGLYAGTNITGGALTPTYTHMGKGWYRLTAQFTATAATWYVGFYMPASQTVYVDAFQVERIPGTPDTATYYPTTYIPTTDSTITRAADTLTYSAPTGLQPDRGTVSVWFRPQWLRNIGSDNADKYIFWITDYLRMYLDATTNDRVNLDAWNGGSWVNISNTGTATINQYAWNHLVLTWNANGSNTGRLNGTNITTTTTSWTPQNPVGKTLYVGSNASNTNQADALISEISFFNRILDGNETYQLWNNNAALIDYYNTVSPVLQADSGLQLSQAGNLNISGNFMGGLGSAAAPTFGFGSDTNSGFFSPGADTLGFSVGGAEQLRIDSSGNVGIGTTSPSDKLDVAGGVKIGASYVGVGLTAPANGLLVQGNVGIGLTSPNAKLEVSTSGYGLGSLTGIKSKVISTGSVGSAYGGYFEVVDQSADSIDYGYGVYSKIYEDSGIIGTGYGFYADCDDAATCYGLYVDAGDAQVTTDWGIYVTGEDKNYLSGNVGIGTSNPNYKLDVNGSVNIGASALIGSVASVADNNRVLTLSGAGSGTVEYLDTTSWDKDSSDDFGAWILAGDGGTSQSIGSGNTATFAGGIGISTTASATDLLTINVNQGYGFAWTGNQSWAGTSTFNNNVYLPGSGIWNSSGNVGIGTTEPGSYKLNVNGTAAFNNAGTTIDSSNYVNAERFVDIGSNYYLDPANTTTSLLVAGNVGIGTTSPGAKLDVNGTAWLRGTGTSGLFVNSSGNVGIGLTNPGYKLDVNGNVNIGGSAIIGSIASVSDNNRVLTSSGAGSGTVQYLDTTNWDKNSGDDFGAWILAGDGGTSQSIGSGNTATFVGGIGIATTAGATDLLTINVNQGYNFAWSGTHSYSAADLDLTNATSSTLDVTGDLYLDADGGDILFGDAGTWFGGWNAGNLGVGTTAPKNKLDISGAVAIGSLPITALPQANMLYVSGNVGIGTTGPGAKLESRSTTEQLRLSYDNTYYTQFTESNNGTLTLNLNGSGYTGDFHVTTQGWTDAFHIDANQAAVGVGTTNPYSGFELSHASKPGIVITAKTDSDYDPYIKFRIGATPVDKFLIGVDNSDSDKFKIAGDGGIGTEDFITIDSGGNVGIGTTSPNYKLDVNGNVNIGGSAIIGSIASVSDNNRVLTSSAAGSGTVQYLDTTNWDKSSADDFGAWILAGDGGTSQSIGSGNTATFTGGIGIATTAGATDLLTINVNQGYNFAWSGTHSYSAADLDLTNATSTTLDTTGDLYLDADGGDIVFGDAGTWWGGWKAGNLGIGTTGPLNKLDVSGAVAIGSLPTTALPQANMLYVSGNVGIGTTGPTYKLDIRGTAATSGINTDVGLNLTQVTNPTGGGLALVAEAGNVDAGLHYYWVTYTTALGETGGYTIGSITTDAGHGKVTVTVPISSDPRVTGRKLYRTKADATAWSDYYLDAIADNTTATYLDNIADSSLTLGPYAAFYRTNTTNRQITLNGSSAMMIDPNATYFGYRAGESVTYGGKNSFFGAYAGRSVTTGENSFFGQSAGQLTTTGSYNVAMGREALANNISGYMNVAIGGVGTLYYNVSGGYNVVVGAQALRGESTYSSSNNVILGYQSAYVNTTGSNNIFIGYKSAESNTTGTKNIVIGYDTDLPAVDSTNMLNIGNLIYGTTLDGSGTSLSTGNVGIGTTSPNYKLDVNGNVNIGGSAIIGSIASVSDNNRVLTSSAAGSGTVQYLDTTNWDKNSSDDFGAWILAGSGGTSQTIGAGNTATFVGGIGIATTAGATDLLTINVNQGYGFGWSGTHSYSASDLDLTNATSTTLDTTGDLYLDADGGDILFADNGVFLGGFSAGNFGIGTTGPSQKLDVNGNVNIGGSAIIGSIASVSDNNRVLTSSAAGSGTVQYLDTTNWDKNSSDDFGAWILAGSGGTPQSIGANNTATFAGGIGISTTASATDLLTINVNQGYNFAWSGTHSYSAADIDLTNGTSTTLDVTGDLYLDADGGDIVFGDAGTWWGGWKAGNLGIGTTGPLNKLDVSGAVAIGSLPTTALPQANMLYVSGNVGIGTTAPQYALSLLQNSSNYKFGSYSDATHFGYILPFDWSTGAFVFNHQQGATGGYDFQYAGTSQVYISTTGNVGIGTTSPNYKLDVNGNVNIGGSAIIGSIASVADNNRVLTSSAAGSGTVQYLDTTNWDKNSSDDFGAWILAGSGGTSQTIGAGNTATFVGGIGIATTAGATDLLTINVNQGYNFAWSGTHSYSASDLDLTNATSTTLDTTGDLYLDADGGDILFADNGVFLGGFSAGNFGIGTTGPAQKLSVLGNIETVADTTSLGSELVTNGTFVSDLSGWTNNGFTTFEWQTGTMHIAQTGTGYSNVYQNTVTLVPGELYYYSVDATLNSGTSLIFQQGPNTSIAFWSSSGTKTGTFIASADSANTIRFKANNAALDWNLDNISIKKVGDGNIIARGLIVGGANINGGTTGIKILDSGNVGIGTTNPNYKLDVNGNVNIGGSAIIGSIASVSDNNRVLTSSGAGSGTVQYLDTTNWDKNSSDDFGAWVLAGSGGTPQSIGAGNTATFAAGIGIATTASATDLLTINVNQGYNFAWSGTHSYSAADLDLTNATSSTLDVTGDLYLDADGGDIVFGDAGSWFGGWKAGNLGIGTTGPNEQLEITGNLRMPATTATTGIIKMGADRYLHSYYDLSNTFLGVQAGNLTMSGTGDQAKYNTAIGYQALDANTTGYANTAIGYQSLTANTSGYGNFAAGRQALYTNTSGYSNFAAGTYALYYNTEGNYNTAIGESALESNTDGDNNVAIGFWALKTNGSGNRNIAIGPNALRLNSSGNDNIAMGSESLWTNTGSNNIAIGTSTLDSGGAITGNIAIGFSTMRYTTGNYNTALGTYAAFYQGTGSNNVFLGYQAGMGPSSYNASGNILIGYQAGYNETGSNKLYIENSNSSTPLIWGDFSTDTLGINGNVGIGTTNPNYKLDVNGNVNIGGSAIIGSIASVSDNNRVLTSSGAGSGTVQYLDTTNWDKNSSDDFGAWILAGSGGTPQSIGAGNTATFVGGIGIATTASATDTLTINVNQGYGFAWTGAQSWANTATFNGNVYLPGTGIWNTSGNVGIGLTSPTDKLDIAGGVKIGASYVGVGLTAPTNGLLVQGNVGIGTTGPFSALDVIGTITTQNASGQDRLFINSYYSGSNPYIYQSTSNSHFLRVENLASGTLGMTVEGSVGIGYTDPGTATLAISGNVGIGTTNPSQKLDVNGNVNIGGSALIGSIASVADNNRVLTSSAAGSGTVQYLDTTNWDKNSSDDFGAWILAGSGGTPQSIGAGNTATFVGGIGIATTAGATDLLTINVNQGYNFGWSGTHSYSAADLDLTNGTSTTLDVTGDLYLDADGGDILFADNGVFLGGFSAGNFGIGTTGPGTTLQVTGSSHTYVTVKSSASSANAGIYLTGRNSNTDYQADIWADYLGGLSLRANDNSSGNLYFLTNSQERMRIGYNGNVGIGTTSPNYKLDVNGNVNIGGSAIIGSIASVSDNNRVLTSSAAGSGTVQYLDTTNWDKNSSDDFGAWVLAGSGGTSQTIGAGNTATFVGGIGISTTASATDLLTINVNQGYGFAWSGAQSWSNTATFNNNVYLPSTGIWNTSGNVGIGTTDPGYKLDVNGNVNIGGSALIGSIASVSDNNRVLTSSAAGSGTVQYLDTTNWDKDYTDDGGEWTLAGNGGTPQIIGTGNTATFVGGIGIATTASATDLLTINVNQGYGFAWTGAQSWSQTSTFNGSIDLNNILDLDANDASNYAANIAQTGNGGGLFVSNTGSGISFRVDDEASETSPFLIDAGGNIGIGKTNPTYKLDVNGNVNIGGSAIIGSIASVADNNRVLTSSGAGSGTVQYLDSSAWDKNASDDLTTATNLWVLAGSGGTSQIINVGNTATFAAGIGIATTAGATDLLTINVNQGYGFAWSGTHSYSAADLDLTNATSTTLDTTGDLYLDADGGDILFADNGVFLGGFSAGNFGIGTTGPSNKLQVVGKDATSGSDFIALFQEPGITPEASAVLGTVADRAISVQGAGGAFFLGRDVTNDIEFVMGTSSLGEAFAGAMTAHDMSLRTDNLDRLTVKATSGNVGIGTTNPNYKLDVNGNVNIGGSAIIGSIASVADNNRVLTSSGAGSGTVQYLDTTNWDKSTADDLSTSTDLWVLAGSGGTSQIINVGNTATFAGGIGIATTAGATDLLTINVNQGYGFAWTGNQSWAGTSTFNGNVYLPGTGIWNTSGNVGIGITNPTAKLEVNGNLKVGGTASFNSAGVTIDSNSYVNAQRFQDIGSSYFLDPAAGTISLVTSGNVGIGTTSPGQKLDVAGNIELANYLYFDNGSTEYLRWDGSDFILSDDLLPSSNDQLNLGSDSARWASLYLGAETLHLGSSVSDEGTIQYNTGTNDFIIDSTGDVVLQSTSGNVGIGTTSPQQALDLYSSGNTTLRIISPGTSNYSLMRLTQGATDQWEVGVSPASSNTLFYISGSPGGGATADGLVINQSGNVGIGTTGPGAALHVKGSSSNALRLEGSSPDELADLYVGGDGRLIISTTPGSDSLGMIDFRSEDDLFGYVFRDSSGAGTSTYLNMYVVDTTTDYVNFVINSGNGTTGLVLDDNNNVGIGTTAPTAGYELDIVSASNADLRLGAGGSASFITNVISGGRTALQASGNLTLQESGGNVGIGMLEPTVTLDVNGSVIMRQRFDYQREITITNSGGVLSDYDVVIEVDTATLISNSKMQSDCDDVRFMDSDKTTPLTYWLEQGCNTAATQFWVRVPTIPASSDKIIYLAYGNTTAINGSETYAGSFIVMFNVSCPTGWSSFTGLNSSNRFPRGSATYGGTGGATAHAVHTYSGTTAGPSVVGAYGTLDTLASNDVHTHTYSSTVSSTANNQLPPYLDVVFCSSGDPAPLLPTSSISWYSSLPSGWTSFTGLNSSNRFPRGNTSYGGTGGATTHTHPYSVTSSGPSAAGQSGNKALVPNNVHTHTVSGTTNSGANVPPYLDVIAATPDATAPFKANVIVPTDSNSAPPLGWNLFTSLNSSNLFPRGNTSYGGTGGGTSHNHTSNGTQTSQGPSNDSSNLGAVGNPAWTANTGHTHTFSFTASTATGIQPPYLDVVFIQRKTVAVSVALGGETASSSSPTIFFSDTLYGNVGIGTMSIGAYLFRVGGAMIAQSYATGHIIESRIYPQEEELFTVGDLLSLTEASGSAQNTENARFTKTNHAYDQNIIGVAEYNETDGYRPTISGVFTTKVSTLNGPIKAGDPITSSEIPGVGMKTTKAGPIVGKALEDTNNLTIEQFNNELCPSEQQELLDLKGEPIRCGKILVFINISLYDPDFYLTDTGDLYIEKEGEELVLKDSSGSIITRVGAFAEAAIAQLKAGLIQTQELIADTLTVNQKLVSPVVETQEIKKLSKIEIKGEDESGFGKLLIQNEQGETVASIDSAGNATFSGELTASKSKFGELLIKNEQGETVASIDATGSAHFTGIVEAEEVRAKKVVAEEIVGLEGKFGELIAASMSARYISQSFEPQIPEEEEDYSEIQALIDQILNTSLEATPQAELGDTKILGDYDIKSNGNLTVLGATSLADTSIAGALNIGGTMSLADSSINSLSGTIYLQNLGLGGIDLLAGKIVIDQEGNMIVEGDVTVKKSLFANIISPLAEQDLTIDLKQKPIEEGQESSFGKLIVKGVDEEVVASIEASGTATFKKLAIAKAEEETIQISTTEIETNATAGEATLPAGETEMTIKSPFVTEKTMIYVTPTSSTQNKVLFVKAKKAHSDLEMGWVKIGLDRSILTEIKFNWWIIN